MARRARKLGRLKDTPFARNLLSCVHEKRVFLEDALIKNMEENIRLFFEIENNIVEAAIKDDRNEKEIEIEKKLKDRFDALDEKDPTKEDLNGNLKYFLISRARNKLLKSKNLHLYLHLLILFDGIDEEMEKEEDYETANFNYRTKVLRDYGRLCLQLPGVCYDFFETSRIFQTAPKKYVDLVNLIVESSQDYVKCASDAPAMTPH